MLPLRINIKKAHNIWTSVYCEHDEGKIGFGIASMPSKGHVGVPLPFIPTDPINL